MARGGGFSIGRMEQGQLGQGVPRLGNHGATFLLVQRVCAEPVVRARMQVKEGEESVGHESGRKIVSLPAPLFALFNADVDGRKRGRLISWSGTRKRTRASTRTRTCSICAKVRAWTGLFPPFDHADGDETLAELIPPPELLISRSLLRPAHEARESHARREIGRGAREDQERPVGEFPSASASRRVFLSPIGFLEFPRADAID